MRIAAAFSLAMTVGAALVVMFLLRSRPPADATVVAGPAD
jgi:hypothetical protein